MSKLFKIIAVIAVTAFALTLAVPAAQAGHHCQPVKIAMSTACFHDQMAPLMSSKMFKMEMEVTDMGGGMMDVGFYFVPKCLDDPIPCRIATRYVGGTVNCNTGTAVCD